MNPSVSDRIGQIINPSPRTAAAPPSLPVEPLQSVPVLIGWMLGPPSPMPRRRAMVDAEVQVITPAATDPVPVDSRG